MEVFLILIHIVLFSSDNLEPGQELDHKAEAENIQTNYMLFLHRYNNNSHEVDWFNQYSFIVSSNFEVIWTLNRVTKRLNKICQAALQSAFLWWSVFVCKVNSNDGSTLYHYHCSWSPPGHTFCTCLMYNFSSLSKFHEVHKPSICQIQILRKIFTFKHLLN